MSIIPHQGHLQKLPVLLHSVKSLLSPNLNQRQQAQRILIEQRDLSYSEFVHQFLQLIIYTHDEQDKHLCLLYLRNLFCSYTRPMPDFVKQLEQLIGAVPVKMRELAIDCMNVYLNKPHNNKHKKHYIDSLITKLSQCLTQNTLNIPLLQRITQILGHSSQKKKSGNNFTNFNQKTIYQIVTRYSFGWPDYEGFVISKEWVRFILGLCNYTGFLPSALFVVRNLGDVDGGLGAADVVKLTDIFNQIHNRFTDSKQLYQLLRVQLKRVTDKKFRQELDEIGDDGESFQTMIKSIQHAIVDILAMKQGECQEQKRIFQQLLSPQFFTSLAETLLLVPNLTNPQKTPILHVLPSILQSLQSQNTPPDKICEYVCKICKNLQQSSKEGIILVYELMANVSGDLMKYFQYRELIVQEVGRFVGGGWGGAGNGWRELEQFLGMVAWYLRNCLDQGHDQPRSSIAKLIQYCLSFSPPTPPRFKPLTFSLICQYQVQPHKSPKSPTSACLKQLQYKQTLKIGYQLLTQILTPQQQAQSQTVDEQSVELVLEGLRDLSLGAGMDEYLDSFHQAVLGFLRQVVDTRNHKMANVCVDVIRIMGSYLRITYVLDNSIISIINLFLSSNNQALQSQSTQLTLSTLLLLNTNYLSPSSLSSLSSLSSSPQHQYLQSIHKILQTPLLAYIQSNLVQQNDDPLFSKIMIELIIHEEGYLQVRDMLARVVQAASSAGLSYGYCYDRVWEAIVVVYGWKHWYGQAKGIEKRVDEMRMGKMESLFESMSIQDQQSVANQYQMKKPSQMKWCQLPDVRRIIDPSSIAGEYISAKIHSCLF